jgi:hypothetical protein
MLVLLPFRIACHCMHRTYIDALYRKEWVFPTVEQTTVEQTTNKQEATDSEDTDSSAGIYVVSTRYIEKYSLFLQAFQQYCSYVVQVQVVAMDVLYNHSCVSSNALLQRAAAQHYAQQLTVYTLYHQLRVTNLLTVIPSHICTLHHSRALPPHLIYFYCFAYFC